MKQLSDEGDLWKLDTIALRGLQLMYKVGTPRKGDFFLLAIGDVLELETLCAYPASGWRRSAMAIRK